MLSRIFVKSSQKIKSRNFSVSVPIFSISNSEIKLKKYPNNIILVKEDLDEYQLSSEESIELFVKSNPEYIWQLPII
jgi:hypothetical protein